MLWFKLIVFFAQFYSGQALCKPTNIEFPVYRMFPKRSIVYYYEVRAEPCPGFTTFYYHWLVSSEKMELIQEVSSTRSVLKLDGYKFKDPLVYNKTYGITVRISHYKNFAVYAYDTIYFQFVPDPIKLAITGGHRRTHPYTFNLPAQFTKTSRDYSYAPGEDQYVNNNFTWYCDPAIDFPSGKLYIWHVPSSLLEETKIYTVSIWMRRDIIPKMVQEITATQEVIITRDVPLVYINCIRNCHYSDNEDEVVLRASCNGTDCKVEDFRWYSTPNVLKNESIEFGQGQDMLLIKPLVADPGTKHTFGMTIRKSFAEWNIDFIPNVSKGKCEITPTSGTVGITYFSIICTGFSSTLGSLTYLVYEGSPSDWKKSVLVKISTDNIITGIRLAGIDNKVTVVAQDPHNKETKVDLQVTLKPYSNIKDAETKMKFTVLGSGAYTLEWFKLRGDIDGLVQTVSIIMKTLSDIKDMTSNDRIDIMVHIMDNLYGVDYLSISRARQILSVVPQITSQKLTEDTRTMFREAIILFKVSQLLLVYIQDVRSFYVSLNYVQEFGRQILDAVSDLILKNKEILQYLEKDLVPHYYDSYDDMQSEKIRMRRELLGTMARVVSAVESVGRAVALKLYDNQREWKVQSKAVTLSMRKINYNTLKNEDKEKIYINGTLNVTRVELSSKLLNSLGQKYKSFCYVFALYYQNPFWFHVESPILNTDGISFTFTTERGKTIEKTDYSIIMYLNITNSQERHEGALTGTLEVNEMVIYRITIKKGITLMIYFDEYNKHVKFLFQSCLPTKDDVLKYGKAQQDYRYEPNDKSPNFMYLAILNTDSEPIFFNVSVEVIKCVNFEAKTGSFSKINWKPVVYNNTLHCESAKFSFFTGMLGKVPHWKEEPQDTPIFLFGDKNFYMLIILIIVFVLWALLMALAFIRDRKLARRNLIFYLNDNVPGDSCGYLMIVITGSKPDSGTTANVGFQLIGSEGTSRTHLIKCDHYKALQKSNEDWFIIYCPRSLGEIRTIRLWHDCTGRKPHWYCSRIVVQELFTGQQYCFIVEKWFSLIWGDSEIYREIPVTPKRCLKSRKIIFPMLLRYNFHNGYLWLSVFSSSPQSNFTTKERVTCLISLLLLSMLVSALFYGITYQSEKDWIFENSNFSLSWTEFRITMLTMAVIIPPSILIYILFRKSGPPPLYIKQKKSNITKEESDVLRKEPKKQKATIPKPKKAKKDKPKKKDNEKLSKATRKPPKIPKRKEEKKGAEQYSYTAQCETSTLPMTV